MERLTRGTWTPGRSALSGLAWLGGAIAWMVAALFGALLAVFFAATMVVIALMTTAVLAFAGFALRARRTVRAGADPNLIEARNVGGHSWVAYGWDGR